MRRTTLLVAAASQRLAPPRALCAPAETTSAKADVLSNAAQTGDYATALTLLDELCAEAEANTRWPHPRCFDQTIAACSRSEPPRWEDALQVLQRMGTFGLAPRLHAFNYAIAACARMRSCQAQSDGCRRRS